MKKPFFLTVCLNPTLQKTFVFKELYENEVNRCPEHYLDASGKGINVSRVLLQLKQEVIHLTQAGGRNRELFLSLAKRDNIDCQTVESGSEIRTCYTLLNRNKQTTTEIIEESMPVQPDTETQIFRKYLELLPDAHTIIISGTKAPGFSNAFYPKMVEEAKKMGKAVILDLKGDDLINSLPFSPDFIKPNLSEFVGTFFQDISIGENETAEALLEQVGHKIKQLFQEYHTVTILTRGRHGVLFLNQSELMTLPAEMIEPVNTIGCGDAFTAGFMAGWLESHQINSAIIKGMETAKLNALSLKPGNIIL